MTGRAPLTVRRLLACVLFGRACCLGAVAMLGRCAATRLSGGWVGGRAAVAGLTGRRVGGRGVGRLLTVWLFCAGRVRC